MTLKKAKQLKPGDIVCRKDLYGDGYLQYTVTETKSKMDEANMHEYIYVYGVTSWGTDIFATHKQLM